MRTNIPSNTGTHKRKQWQRRPQGGGHRFKKGETRRGTMGDKTLAKVDTPSNSKADTLR